ncbi:MAG TPA: ABC transporter transmembrane domain-containing protein [Polyangiaceae bacterium]|nr:ABC transporter transmembrane domain-containing protein [Polyangiaceae bacterium]
MKKLTAEVHPSNQNSVQQAAERTSSAAHANAVLESRVECAGEFLRLRGIRVTRQQLREALVEDSSLAALAEEVTRRGCPVRLLHCQPEDVGCLDLPTLVGLVDGSSAVLVRMTLRSVYLRLDDGRTVRVYRKRLGEVWTGEALELAPQLPAALSFRARIWAILQRHPRVLAQFLLASGFFQALALGVPLLLRTALDTALPDGAESMLYLLTLGIVMGAASQAWFAWFREAALRFLHARVLTSLNRGLLEHVLHLPFSYHQQKGLGELTQVVTAGDQVSRLATDVALTPLTDGVLGLMSLALLVYLLPSAALVVLVACLVFVAGAVVVGKRQGSYQTQELAAQAEQNGFLLELVAGAQVIKATGAEQPSVVRWIQHLAKERWPSLRRQRLGLWLEVGGECLRNGLLMFLLAWGGRQALAGALSLGTLIAAIQLAEGFAGSTFRVADACVKLYAARAYAITLENALARPTQPSLKPALDSRGLGDDAIVLEDVWFRYEPGSPWILKGFSLRVRAGEEHRLMGPSGCGKTTLLRLIAGLYEPERGAVLIHGVDASVARRRVAYLPQETYLFQGSIFDNLRVLSGGASRERILQAAQLTGLDELIRTLPMGYETVLPPGGYTFSGGQRQLIALSACVASERNVLLLDEAMSHLDRLTQARLVQSPLFEGKTLVSVVHEVVAPEPSSTASRVTIDEFDALPA